MGLSHVRRCCELLVQRLSGCQIPAAVVQTRLWSCTYLKARSVYRRKAIQWFPFYKTTCSFVAPQITPYPAPECRIRYLQFTHMCTMMNTISFSSTVSAQRRANIQIYVWHFQMNYSGLTSEACMNWTYNTLSGAGHLWLVRSVFGWMMNTSSLPLRPSSHWLLMQVCGMSDH